MRRRWWHVLIIASSVVVIAGIGVVAIWGPSIRTFFESASGAEGEKTLPGPSPSAGGGGVL